MSNNRFHTAKKNLVKRRFVTGVVFLFVIIILGMISFSSLFHRPFVAISRPFVAVADFFSERVYSVGAIIRSKNSYQKEITSLKESLTSQTNDLLLLSSLEKENTELKEILGRISLPSKTLLAFVTAKPNRSPYDSLALDIGERDGARVSQMVYGGGDIPIGTLSEVRGRSSTATLFSTPGQETPARLSGSGLDVVLIGDGGGTFTLTLPREVVVSEGEIVTALMLDARAVATVVRISSDPQDSFQKIYLRSPINIQTLSFVTVALDE